MAINIGDFHARSNLFTGEKIKDSNEENGGEVTYSHINNFQI